MPAGLHPVLEHGPLGLIVASGLISMAVAPSVYRFVRRRRRGRDDDEFDGMPLSPKKDRLIAFGASVIGFWILALAAGAVFYSLDPDEVPGRLPGDHLDATVLAHTVFPYSRPAKLKLIRRLIRLGTEDALALAARMEENPYWAVRHLAAHGFRTHAGRFAVMNPNDESCPLAMDGLAEAQRGGALQEAFVACRNVPGDSIGMAAFKMGDFRLAVGPESETIVSRLPRPPRGEPSCLAGAFDIPDAEMPLCRVIHAELKSDTRDEILAGARPKDPFAQRWTSALRLERLDRGDFAEGEMFAFDAASLLRDPGQLFEKEPVAIDATLRDEHASLGTETRLWLDLVFAAERSVLGHHEEALTAADRAAFVLAELALSAEHEAVARRMLAAIALRAGNVARATELAGDEITTLGPFAASWSGDVAADLATAITIATDDALPAALLLRDLPEAVRPSFHDFLRERYPACDRCGFFRQLGHHLRRRDIAEAAGDDKLVADLDPVLARFEAVALNRTLQLSLVLGSEEIGR